MIRRMRVVPVPVRTVCGIAGVLLLPSLWTVFALGRTQWWFLPPLSLAFLFVFVTGRVPLRGAAPDRGEAPPLRLVPADEPAPDLAATAWDPLPAEEAERLAARMDENRHG